MFADLKRKRSTETDHNAYPLGPPAKVGKTQNTLQINYLVRQFNQDLPILREDQSLVSILALLNDYDGVLQRNESMAGNLGAKPMSTMLIRRFERLFEGPPQVLQCHGKDGTHVTWLDVAEFARMHPEQFRLEQTSEGVRVCRFYTKQCRVQISQEDYDYICSGVPQKIIPAQPIIEDEEKELEALGKLDRTLVHIAQQADQGEFTGWLAFSLPC